jgi:hypothetical protein
LSRIAFLHADAHSQIAVENFCLLQVSASSCQQIANMWRKLQRLDKSRLLFLDETAVRLSEAPTPTLVAPDEQPYVVVADTTTNAKRFDIIACINGDRAFAPVIYTPKERSDAGVKGINTEMLVDYILSTLGQETAALDNPPLTLVVDQARIHHEERIMEAFREPGGHVMQLLKTPPQAAKRLSPLDNSLFHDWKEAIRKRCPLTLRNIEQVMADEWNNITASKIAAHYKHCGLFRDADPYFDCPHPASHRHSN